MGKTCPGAAASPLRTGGPGQGAPAHLPRSSSPFLGGTGVRLPASDPIQFFPPNPTPPPLPCPGTGKQRQSLTTPWPGPLGSRALACADLQRPGELLQTIPSELAGCSARVTVASTGSCFFMEIPSTLILISSVFNIRVSHPVTKQGKRPRTHSHSQVCSEHPMPPTLGRIFPYSSNVVTAVYSHQVARCKVLLHISSLFSIPASKADVTENNSKTPLEDHNYFSEIKMF